MENVHKVTTKLEGKEWSSILDGILKKKIKETKIDGFRKGAIPKDVYLKRFGMESLYGDAIDSALQVAYKKVLDESNLIPVIEPAVDIKKIDDKEVEFEFTITTKPEVKLGKYKDLGIEKEKVTISKKEIDEEIESLKLKMADIVVKEKGTVEDKNTAIIDFEGKVEGKLLEGGTGQDYPLEIGSNTFIPGFETALIGMKVGEEKTIDLKFPDNYTDELKGKDVSFKVTIKGIKERVIPELNKDLYQDLGYDNIETEEDFRKELKTVLKERKEKEVEDKLIDAKMKKAVENMEVEINHEIIHEEIHRMLHQYEEQLKMQGLNLEQYFEFTKTTQEDLEANMHPEAENRIKGRYLLEAIVEKEKIDASEEEVNKHAEKMAEQYGMDSKDIIEMLGGLEVVKYDAQMRKAIEFIKEN